MYCCQKCSFDTLIGEKTFLFFSQPGNKKQQLQITIRYGDTAAVISVRTVSEGLQRPPIMMSDNRTFKVGYELQQKYILRVYMCIVDLLPSLCNQYTYVHRLNFTQITVLFSGSRYI